MIEETESHRAGFVNLIGRPNAGKSTLVNQLLGYDLSVATPRAQTTRHQIFGILNEADMQIVFSDTPGIIRPNYALQNAMMRQVRLALDDADLLLLLTHAKEKPDPDIVNLLEKASAPIWLIINKIDLNPNTETADSIIANWKEAYNGFENVFNISALTGQGCPELLAEITKIIPRHPPYFPKEDDEISDKPLRFFLAEIIRGKIFTNYRQEVPYACHVEVSAYKEKENITVIEATIYVERNSQKGILIGKAGSALRALGRDSRREIEKFLGTKVFLETRVKVDDDWRKKDDKLNKFGY